MRRRGRARWLAALLPVLAGMTVAPSWADKKEDKAKEVRCKDENDCKERPGEPGELCWRGACAYYDETCEAAPWRYTDTAPAELRGKCVPTAIDEAMKGRKKK